MGTGVMVEELVRMSVDYLRSLVDQAGD